MGDFAKEIISQINPKVQIICDDQLLCPEKSEVNRLLGANSKIKALIGAKIYVCIGIAETIEWFQGYKEMYKQDLQVERKI